MSRNVNGKLRPAEVFRINRELLALSKAIRGKERKRENERKRGKERRVIMGRRRGTERDLVIIISNNSP